MIRNLLFGARSFALTKGGLDAGALRQRVISENTANAVTPGYQARKVAFEELIQEARDTLPLARTQAGHIPAQPDGVPAPRESTTRDPIPAGAINNVDLEQELVLMKQNEIHYNALSQLLARKYKGLEQAIR